MTTTIIPRRPTVQTGQRVELARYTVPAGERILWGQRVSGVVRVTDCPAVPGQGRSFLVERELEQDGNAALQALVMDYRAVAEQLRAIPMASSASYRYVEYLDQDAGE
jgi:hypothetical protein